jgi:hypothetical protein
MNDAHTPIKVPNHLAGRMNDEEWKDFLISRMTKCVKVKNDDILKLNDDSVLGFPFKPVRLLAFHYAWLECDSLNYKFYDESIAFSIVEGEDRFFLIDRHYIRNGHLEK